MSPHQNAKHFAYKTEIKQTRLSQFPIPPFNVPSDYKPLHPSLYTVSTLSNLSPAAFSIHPFSAELLPLSPGKKKTFHRLLPPRYALFPSMQIRTENREGVCSPASWRERGRFHLKCKVFPRFWRRKVRVQWG